MDTEALGLAIIALGGSHRELGDPIDHSVGIEMLVRIGERVQRGQPLVRIFSRDRTQVDSGIRKAITIGDEGRPPDLIVERFSSAD